MAGSSRWTVALTRPERKQAGSRELLEEAGFRVRGAPFLAIEPHEDPAFARVLEDMHGGDVDAVVFTGSTGVRHTWSRAAEQQALGHLQEALERSPVVAVGPRTAAALRERDVEVHAVPEVHSSQGLVAWFRDHPEVADHVAILRSTRGTPVLPGGLRDLGMRVREVHVYHLTRPPLGNTQERVLLASAQGDVDAWTFTSSLTVKHFMELAQDVGVDREALREHMRAGVVAAIGEPTRGTLEAHGVPVDLVPSDARFEALVEGLVRLRDE